MEFGNGVTKIGNGVTKIWILVTYAPYTQRDIQIEDTKKTSENFSTVIEDSKKAVAIVNEKAREVKLLEKNIRSYTELTKLDRMHLINANLLDSTRLSRLSIKS